MKKYLFYKFLFITIYTILKCYYPTTKIIMRSKYYSKKMKRDFPRILSEYNRENFFKIYEILKKKNFCYSYLYDENIFKKFNDNEIKKLINGRYKLEKYSKNSVNIFFIPKNKI